MQIDILPISIAVALGIEQVFCFILGSYPYRYGIPIKKIKLLNNDIASWQFVQKNCHGLKIKISETKQEVYCRFKYPFGTLVGPLLFTAQAKLRSPDILLIRLGPCAALYLLYVVIGWIVRGGLYDHLIGILKLLVLLVAFAFFYFLLVRSIKDCIAKVNKV